MQPVIKEIRFSKSRNYRTDVHEVSAAIEHGRQPVFNYSYSTSHSANTHLKRFDGEAPSGLYKTMILSCSYITNMLAPIYQDPLTRFCEGNFYEQKEKIIIHVGGHSYEIYPRYAARARPIRRHLKAAEKLTGKFDTFKQLYYDRTFSAGPDAVLREGVEFATADMSFDGLCTLSELPGIKFKVTISEDSMKDGTLEKTLAHEMFHANFTLAGAPRAREGSQFGFLRLKRFLEEDLVMDEDARYLDAHKHVIVPLAERLITEGTFVIKT